MHWFLVVMVLFLTSLLSEKLSVYDENLLMVFRMLKPKNDDEEIIIFLQQLTGGMNRSVFNLVFI